MTGSVVIVGAGMSGLAAAKAAREYGLEPTVYERADDVGGLWRPDDGLTWPGLRTNVSRHTCCFSDLPWRDDEPDFPTAAGLHAYLGRYADTFDLRRYVVTGTEAGPEQLAGADAVVLASGVFSRPWLPDVADGFGGTSLHSGDYRGPDALAGRRVAVVGMSFSGTEIATELGESGVDVTLVVARPAWLLSRYAPGPDGEPLPWDLVAARRAAAPTHRERNRNLYERGADPGRMDPRLRLDPESDEPARVVFAERLPALVRDGRVRLALGRVVGATGSGLVLDDGATPLADAVVCDTVIWATGYRTELPAGAAVGAAGTDPDDPLQPLLLDRATLHPDLPRTAFVGLYRGPQLGVIELQARWAAAVLSGALPRPSPSRMADGAAEALAIRRARPRPQFPYRDPVALGDRIAAELGVLPGPDDVDADDPVVPAQYRLRGPGADPDAARAGLSSARRRMGFG